MTKIDISGLSLEDLSALIEEATKLRASKVEAKRQELQKQLAELDSIEAPRTSQTSSNRPPVKPLFRGPKGETFSGRGAIPRWAKDLGITDREGLEKYRIKD